MNSLVLNARGRQWVSRMLVVLSAVVWVSVTFGTAGAATINFQAGVSPTPAYTMAETDLRESSATSNFAGARINVGSLSSSATSRMRNVLSFDLDVAGGVTPGEFVTGATLTFSVWGRAGWNSNTDLLEVRALTTNFTESTATWNSPWTTPGGDFPSTVLTSLTNTTGTSFTFPSTPALVAAANDAIVNNNGVLNLILIAPNNEGLTATSFIELYSAEFATPINGGPLLTLTTAIPAPEPGTCALALGGLLILRRKR